MTMRPHRDPRPVVIADRIYRMLLRAYPRRFRGKFREEMALVFRDSCRQIYLDIGPRGLVRVSARAVSDLVRNAPAEHIVRLTHRAEQHESMLSCSGCYSVVSPDWRVCKICGTVLNAGSTHPTRAATPPSLSSAPDALDRTVAQIAGSRPGVERGGGV
jgi:hypothetical protein